MLIEVVEAEPLSEELGRKPPRFCIGQHPLDLVSHLIRSGQFTSSRGATQFAIWNRGPQEEAQAARHFPLRQWLYGPGRVGCLLDAIEECRCHQDSRQE